jgi:hypothetical protein
LLFREGGWECADFKARSYRREAKKELAPWVIKTYGEDSYEAPPPVTESATLLTFKRAVVVAQQALNRLEAHRAERANWAKCPDVDDERPEVAREDAGQEPPAEVYFPLGLEAREVQAYRVIKPSAFLFRNPEERERALRAMKKFEEKYGCGLEVLALRRGYGGRRQGSLVDIAEAVYALIRAGGGDLTRGLNLTRLFQELNQVQAHQRRLHTRKEKGREALHHAIDTRHLPEAGQLPGWYVAAADIMVARAARAGK